jgi:hypothetical protein
MLTFIVVFEIICIPLKQVLPLATQELETLFETFTKVIPVGIVIMISKAGGCGTLLFINRIYFEVLPTC